MNDLCIHEQYRPTCTICNGADAKARAVEQAPIRPAVFKAKYSGQCPACNLPIFVGDVVAWRQGRPAVHRSCCGEDVPT